jgi:hypothetical protein
MNGTVSDPFDSGPFDHSARGYEDSGQRTESIDLALGRSPGVFEAAFLQIRTAEHHESQETVLIENDRWHELARTAWRDLGVEDEEHDLEGSR